jgi:hypothetical protein
MITIEDIKTKLAGKLHGTSLNKISDIYGKMREAAGNVLISIDPYTTIRRYTIQNALHDKVYNYTAPEDIKGITKIIDLRPVSFRAKNDEVQGTFSKDFDIRKQDRSIAIEVLEGVKTLKIARTLFNRIEFSRLDSLTGLGVTVTGNADVAELDINYQNYIDGNGAISFNTLGGGQAILTLAFDNSFDLTKLKDVGSLFHWVNVPNATGVTNFKLRWGTDSSNYYEKTITSPHDRTAYVSGAWLLNRYNWQGASVTGTPDEAVIAWFEIELNYTGGAITGILLNSLTGSIGKAYELLYYSNRIFRGVDGTYKEAPTVDTDIVMLDPDSENIFLYELAMLCSHEIKGKNFAADFTFWKQLLYGSPKKGDSGLYAKYEDQYPSQAIQHQTTYHNFSDFGSDTVGHYDSHEDGDFNSDITL